MRLLDAFDRQVGWCQQAASPFSARVLARSRMWLATEAQALEELAAVAQDPLAAAVSLRWLSGLHHLALLQRQPWASLWPPAATDVSDRSLDEAIAQAWAEERDHLRAALSNAPQTNEVQRSAALLPGLLHVAAVTGLPLELAEIGSSAGLNLWCDRYRYAAGSGAGAWSWGDPAAALALHPQWQGPRPADAPFRIVRRAGCDMQPVDLLRQGEDLRLASFVWADQAERLSRLRCAIEVARRAMQAEGVAVQSQRAADFVRDQLAQRTPGHAWVLMHSVVWQYIPAAEQADILQQLQAAGRSATPAAPVAWLRFEPPRPDLRVELRCNIWPGGQDTLLAVCHPHGATVEWHSPV